MELDKTAYKLEIGDTLVMKGIAIIGMLCWHLFFCPSPIGVEFSPFVRFISVMGDVCVSVFLFVSGYGLSVSYKKYITSPKSVGRNSFITIVR